MMTLTKASPGVLLRCSRFTIARLRAHGDATRKLIDVIKPAHDGLKSTQAAFMDADDHRIDMQADFDECDLRAREECTNVQLAAIMVVERDFQSPLYTELFPTGLTGLKQMSGEDLRADLPRMIAVLKSLPPTHPLAPHFKMMQAVEHAWVKPAEMLAAAQTRRALADGALGKAKQAWLDAYDALAGALQLEFPRKRSFVSSFFPASRSKKKSVTPPAPVASKAA
jgi:hypothetical protein